MATLSIAAAFALVAVAALAETVNVKYRGAVDLASFKCTDVTRSSFIERVCYDEAEKYMIIRLRGTYYHYCEIPGATVRALLAADSLGRFYNARIKGSGSDGPYDCRTHRAPAH